MSGKKPPATTNGLPEQLKAVPLDGALGSRPLDQTWSPGAWDGALGPRPLDQTWSPGARDGALFQRTFDQNLSSMLLC